MERRGEGAVGAQELLIAYEAHVGNTGLWDREHPAREDGGVPVLARAGSPRSQETGNLGERVQPR